MEDRDIDQFLKQCGATRRPEPTTTNIPTDGLWYGDRRKLSGDLQRGHLSFNVGASPLQGLKCGAMVARSVGDMRQVIAQVEDQHGPVGDYEITYAMTKAGITPLINPAGKWTGADSRRLRGDQ